MAAYNAGMFTTFMEPRAPGHAALDAAICHHGRLDCKQETAGAPTRLDYLADPAASDRAEELREMDIICDVMILFASRHAELAENMALDESDIVRRQELLKIAAACRLVPAEAPRTFYEAL